MPATVTEPDGWPLHTVIWDRVQCDRRASAGEYAVYPGTFDPITPGHLDIIERARRFSPRSPCSSPSIPISSRPAPRRNERPRCAGNFPQAGHNVAVAGWAGLTVAFCRQHGADVIIRGVRNGSDLRHEYPQAAMNQAMGITTLLLSAQPTPAAMSSTVLRGLGT